MSAPAAGPANDKPRVLVVDDELAISRAFARTLTAAGYHVQTADDGEAARAILERESFDLILSDVYMPGLGGIEVLKAARARDLDVSVVLITGTPSDADAAKAVEHGALVYLVKPLDQRALTQVAQNGVRSTRIARLKRAATAGASGSMQVGDRAGLEVGFGRALATLWMAYQPIVRWQSRALHGYEALLRSREPMLPNPPAVLDAAERLGQLPTLGRAIRAKVASSMPRLPEGAIMFINAHPADLADEELFSTDAPLSKVASRIMLEITERASLEHVRDLADRILALRKLGYRIALDDFGDGYAGLAAFARLRPDVVKFDMSIVRNIHKDEVKRSLVSAMVTMCGEMQVAVLGEGVETAEEQAVLSDLGCDLHQGYLYAKPGEPFPAPTF